MSTISLASSTDGGAMQHLGRRLRALREAHELTTIEAGEQTGLSRRTIYRAEQGQNPTLLTLVRLLRLYGRLDALANFLPEPELSPMQLLDAQPRRHKKKVKPRG